MESAAFTTVHADFRLVHRWALTRVDAGDWKPVFGPEAEYVLRQAWNEGLGQRLNHLLCAEEGTSDAEYAQREAVLEKVVSEVRDERMGRWRLLRRTALLALAPIADEPLPTFAPPRPVKAARELDWIEILLVDDQDQPLAEEPYEIVLPDGTTRGGHLDLNGSARLEDLSEPGLCRIRFPRLELPWGPA